MAKKKFKMKHNSEKSTWENTAKEQPYLMPGTDEYDAYTEDLKMHDPFKPDDDWHDKQEDRNANYHVLLKQKAEEGRGQTIGERKYGNHMAKEAKFDVVKDAAIREAEKTETKVDDKIARNLTLDDLDKAIYNDGVTDDDIVSDML